ncbi:hypothetical protein ACWD0Z_06400 [Streptomyces sp. NPDC003007]
MSQTSHDARAVVRALDALTTQVRRLADARPTPVVETDDAPTTEADDGRRYRLAQERNAASLYRKGLISDSELNAVFAATDEDAQRTTRRNSLLNLLDRLDRTRALTPEERTLLRRHVEAETREHDTARSVAAGNKRHVQTIVPEIDRLARELEAANSRADAASRVGTRHMAAAEEAQAVIERVRAALHALKGQGATGKTYYVALTAALNNSPGPGPLCHATDPETLRECAQPIAHEGDHEDGDHSWPARAALDGTEQPTTEPICQHCGHPADWHDQHEGCVGPNGIGGLGSGDCTCTRNPATTTEA